MIAGVHFKHNLNSLVHQHLLEAVFIPLIRDLYQFVKYLGNLVNTFYPKLLLCLNRFWLDALANYISSKLLTRVSLSLALSLNRV